MHEHTHTRTYHITRTVTVAFARANDCVQARKYMHTGNTDRSYLSHSINTKLYVRNDYCTWHNEIVTAVKPRHIFYSQTIIGRLIKREYTRTH